MVGTRTVWLRVTRTGISIGHSKKRYARGEINKQEFDEKRKDLQ
jgi:uncharacterized membrane protein